jgi:zinc/manganese transport system substrate-binding protein
MSHAAGLVVLVTSLALAGCAQTDVETSTISVVASTNVWGSVATAVGGSLVSVTSIIDDPSKDPHEYNASARDQLALSKAQVVIVNGGGYDDFLGTMLAAFDSSTVVSLNAVNIAGQLGDRSNEHVWYDLPAAKSVAVKLSAALTKIDPANASVFSANLREFTSQVDDLISIEASLKSNYSGEDIVSTEPLPHYLLAAIGLVDLTPPAFSEAIEAGTDAAPGVLKATLELFTTNSLRLLAYGAQTTGPETEAVLAAAEQSGIPVVSFTETLPDGKDYLSWMSDNLSNVRAALAQ